MTSSLTPPAAAGTLSTRAGHLVVLMVVVLAAVFGGVGWLQTQSLTLLNANVVYQGDNIVWSFFQLETESLRLAQEMRQASTLPAPASLDALRDRYEIFVSRIALVEPARTRDVMPELEEQRRVLALLHGLVARMDPVIGTDAPALTDPTQVRRLLPEFEAMTKLVRDLSLLANQAVAEGISRRNEVVRNQSRIGIGLTIFQCLLIGAFAYVVVRQLRTLEQRRSELEQLASHLQEARAEAEQASRTKSAFLANMSHELRTPFNGLLGMMSLLDRSALTPQQREYLGIARQSGEHLLTILNDVLDFSKMESGRLALVPSPTDLRQMVNEVQALMAPQARSRGLEFDATLAADLHPVVQADAQRVKQILFNLLGNAIKFTDVGRVRLQVERCHTPQGQPATRFRISDTGIGMGEDTLARLFQRFSQGDESIGRRFGGTGLGLEISRTLAEMMDGHIAVTSQIGQGSEFTVVLPLPELGADTLLVEVSAPAPVPTSPAADLSDRVVVPAEPPSSSLTVLVADDHPVNRKFMQVLLERLGHRVVLATQGAEAVAVASQQACDLVLMDLHMPVMDGLAAARTIRALPLPHSRVLIVALTADAFAESRERVRQAGMDDFLAKPVQLHDIEEMLRRHFGARAIGSMAPAVVASVVDVAPRAAHLTPHLVRVKPGVAARVLDLALIADTCAALSVEAYQSLLSGFLADDSRSLAELQRLLVQHPVEVTACSQAAHRLKGVAANLGLREVAQTAHDIETEAASLTEDTARLTAQRLQEQFDTARNIAVKLGWLAT